MGDIWLFSKTFHGAGFFSRFMRQTLQNTHGIVFGGYRSVEPAESTGFFYGASIGKEWTNSELDEVFSLSARISRKSMTRDSSKLNDFFRGLLFVKYGDFDKWGNLLRANQFLGFFSEEFHYVEKMKVLWKILLIVKLDRPFCKKNWVLEPYLGAWKHMNESCRCMSWTPRRLHERGFSWNSHRGVYSRLYKKPLAMRKNNIFKWKTWFWGLLALNAK